MIPKLLTALVISAFYWVPGGGAAETLVEAYGLGTAAPEPEEWTKINDDLSIRARIVDAASGKLTARAKPGQKLALALDFYVQPGAEDRKITLTCGHYFYNPEGEQKGKEVNGVPCYSGKLSDGTEKFQPLSYRYEFTMGPSTMKGTWALIARVKDTEIGDGIALDPTFAVGGGS